MACSQCQIELVPVQRAKGFSLAGLFSAFVFVCAVLLMAFNFTAGLVLCAFAILLGMLGRGKDTYLVCPKCGRETGPL
jgi:hypothetical protein